MRNTAFITIPRTLTGREELVVLPRRVLVEIMSKKTAGVEEILRLSREAKKLKKENKLPLLRSLKDLR